MRQAASANLQMLLVQQAGPGLLPLSNLPEDTFLQFLRNCERLSLEEHLSPVIVYFSSHDAKYLLPDNRRYRELIKAAFCISQLSEARDSLPMEWGFLLESPRLCLIAYAQAQMEATAGEALKCVGSLDPQVVRQAFSRLMPLWQEIDPVEMGRVEDARLNLGIATTKPDLMEACRNKWPVIKIPSRFAANFETTSGASVGSHQPESRLGAVQKPSGWLHPISAPESNRGIRGLRESWVEQEEEEGRSALPPAAQKIIRDIISQLRHSSNLSAILQLAIEELTRVGQAHRGLIWQVVGDQLVVTNEFAMSGHTCFQDNQLGPQECAAIVYEFLSRFPDESGAGVISIPDTLKDTKLHKLSPTLSSLIELGEVRSRLVAQLRCRGLFSGFLELQQCNQTRQWSEQDAVVLQSVAEILAVVVQQSFDQSKIESDARQMQLLNDIATLFRESRGERGKDSLSKSVKLIASEMGFLHGQIYLMSAEPQILIPQIADEEHSSVELSSKNNPFVAVYESGRTRVVNLEYSRQGDPYFGHETAMVVPLISEGQSVGVLGLWGRQASLTGVRPQDKELAETIAGHLASTIRADQAIAQIRADQARTALINRVSHEIRESLKEVDHITGTLVQALAHHLNLSLCVAMLFEAQTATFVKPKFAGSSTEPDVQPGIELSQRLFDRHLEALKQGSPIFLTGEEIAQSLPVNEPLAQPECSLVTLIPLVHGGKLKAALCMLSSNRVSPFPDQELQMVSDLADRVAVVVSHAELFNQVEQQAVTDPMTGLYNRRYFNEELSKEIDRFQRFGRPFSYIIIDLDFLKKLNDTLGHQFGDAAIKHIAVVIKKNVRDVDIAARWGGEEFVVLLPETDEAAARLVAERICQAIREEPVALILERQNELIGKIAEATQRGEITGEQAANMKSGGISASIGVSTYPIDAHDRDQLTELADQALYLAKHRGRNQVCSVSEDLIPTLSARGAEALEVQQAAIAHKVDELASIDLRLIAEHGILGIMGAVIKLIEARDAYGKDRSNRAAEYANKLAQALHLSQDHITIISLAAVLNNLGKIAIPESLLRKKGPLTDEERKLIEQAPSIGAKILEPAKNLHRVAAIVEAYQEHFDGTGYPKGLKGEEIPLESRIISLTDAYIAMTSDRPYRPALSPQEALELIQQGAGKEWDPRMVKLFGKLLSKETDS